MPYRGHFICFAMVAILFSSASLGEERDDKAAKSNVLHKNACGPFSVLVALRALGIQSTLQEVEGRCDWKESVPVEFDAIRRGLHSFAGIECFSASLTPGKLIRYLEDPNTVVIMAIRKNSEEIDHSVCAVSSNGERQTITWNDYPEWEQEKSISTIINVWDGRVIVVRREPIRRTLNQFLFYSPMFFGVFGLILWLSARGVSDSIWGFFVEFCHWTKKVKLVFLAILFLFCGCNENAIETQGPAKRRSNPFNVSSDKMFHSIGLVDPVAVNLSNCQFTNDRSSAIRFLSAQTSCGCLRIVSYPEVIESGQTGEIEFCYDVRGRVGEVCQTAVLIPDSDEISPIQIQVCATVRSLWLSKETLSVFDDDTEIGNPKYIAVHVAGYPQAKVMDVSVDVDWLSVELLNDASEGTQTPAIAGRFRVLEKVEKAPIGPVGGRVTVKVCVGENKFESIFLPVSGYLSGDVIAEPNRVLLGSITEIESESSCILTFKRNCEFANISVSSSDERIRVLIESTSTKNKWLLRIAAKSGMKARSELLKGDIVGRDRNGLQVFSVPFVGVVMAKKSGEN